MPSDYYSDSEGGAPARSTPEESTSKKSIETPEAEDKPTFLIPKSAFGGRDLNPDDTETIKIVRVMDDQVEAVCTYGDEEKEEEAPEEEGGKEMPMRESQMASLME